MPPQDAKTPGCHIAMCVLITGADPREGRGGDPALDGWWPTNRDARPIKVGFISIRMHQKLAFFELKNRKIFWGGGTAPSARWGGDIPSAHPSPLGAFDASILTPMALDSTRARPRRLGPRRLHSPPSHTSWIRPCSILGAFGISAQFGRLHLYSLDPPVDTMMMMMMMMTVMMLLMLMC